MLIRKFQIRATVQVIILNCTHDCAGIMNFLYSILSQLVHSECVKFIASGNNYVIHVKFYLTYSVKKWDHLQIWYDM